MKFAPIGYAMNGLGIDGGVETIIGTPGPLFMASASRRSEADQARVRRAFQENYAGVWRCLRRMGVAAGGAEDAAQQVFVIALEAVARIRQGCERAFLYGTAVRVAHGLRRRGEREVPSMGLEFLPSPFPAPDQLTDQKKGA
jgi:RNA polymerase sigma-70 factor (ECF subfamily)